MGAIFIYGDLRHLWFAAEGKGCDKAQRSGARRCVVADCDPEHEHEHRFAEHEGRYEGPMEGDEVRFQSRARARARNRV